jgi:hypothetical protein
MKQAIAPALFTQSDLHLDPLAIGRALADGEPKTSMASKASPPMRVECRIAAAAVAETA